MWMPWQVPPDWQSASTRQARFGLLLHVPPSSTRSVLGKLPLRSGTRPLASLRSSWPFRFLSVSKFSKIKPSSAVPIAPSGPGTRAPPLGGGSRSSRVEKPSLFFVPSASREVRLTTQSAFGWLVMEDWIVDEATYSKGLRTPPTLAMLIVWPAAQLPIVTEGFFTHWIVGLVVVRVSVTSVRSSGPPFVSSSVISQSSPVSQKAS